MGNVVYSMSVSLDGYMEAPGGELDWSDPDQELRDYHMEHENQIGAHLYGRGIYQNMASYWPYADEDPAAAPFDAAYAKIWRAKPKVVFSTTLKEVNWNSTLISEDLAGAVAEIKRQNDKDVSLGGAGLAASFLELGLVDEMRLLVNPVLLGAGKPLFPALDSRISWRLADTRTFGSGVVLLGYERR